MENGSPQTTDRSSRKPNNNYRRNRQQKHTQQQQYRQPRNPQSQAQPPRIGNVPDIEKHIYITTQTDFKTEKKYCKEFLNAGHEIHIHCACLGITRGINLALQLVNSSEGALGYIIKTSTIHSIDKNHPLYDEKDVTQQPRFNSAIHIKIFNKDFSNFQKNSLSTETNASTNQVPIQHHHQQERKQGPQQKITLDQQQEKEPQEQRQQKSQQKGKILRSQQEQPPQQEQLFNGQQSLLKRTRNFQNLRRI